LDYESTRVSLLLLLLPNTQTDHQEKQPAPTDCALYHLTLRQEISSFVPILALKETNPGTEGEIRQAIISQL
jgi:hypothetical protein